jgi:hypothetical protein
MRQMEFGERRAEIGATAATPQLCCSSKESCKQKILLELGQKIAP